MKTQDWLIEHDLSITFDAGGRMWKFRPTHSRHGRQPVDAVLTPQAIIITVSVPGLKSGDVDLSATGDVLHVRGRSDDTMHLAADIGMPRRVDLDLVETSCSHDVLEISVPLVAPRPAESAVDTIPVAV